MIDAELTAEIRRLFHAEHWRIGTIARQLGLHRDTVRRALRTERFNRDKIRRPRLTDPYVEFMRETLQRYPTLRATRLFEMIRLRGYQGSVIQVRRLAAELRPQPREAFLRLRAFPAEQGQVDWACFGTVAVGRAKRRLSCLVLTLSHSRALSLEFFFDQSLESFLRGHVRAFAQWGGCPRTRGYLHVPEPWRPDRHGRNCRIFLHEPDKDIREFVETPSLSTFALEVETVAKSIESRQASEMSWQDSLGNMRALDRWRECVGLEYESDRTPLQSPPPGTS